MPQFVHEYDQLIKKLVEDASKNDGFIISEKLTELINKDNDKFTDDSVPYLNKEGIFKTTSG